MGKIQFCRICRTEKNLKYKTKELRELNKKQLLLANATQQGQGNNRASKKLLLTTPTLGNICHVCDERIQIYHRLDEDGGHDSCSDVEIEVVENTNKVLPMGFVDAIPNGDFVQRAHRPETPVIVDDDDMLFNMFMQKFDQKTQMQRHQMAEQQLADGQFVNQFHANYTPPQSSAGGSEGDESKVIEVLTSRENTPCPITQALPPPPHSSSNMIDSHGHRIVAIIELDDVEENDEKNNEEMHSGLLTPAASSLNELSFTESIEHRSGTLSPNKNANFKSPCTNEECQRGAAVDEDDDEIVFRKVDLEQEKSPAIKKRKRKSYDEKELRLVASLSLVSSDSEAEDSLTKIQVKKSSAETPSLILKETIICKVCKIKFPDTECLSVHERIHQGVKCPLCQLGFQQVKRLIHHMRRKHREYNGDTLSEKPRSGQDSCMTIRLRYMQRTTFYECQLCGRIDEIFKEHKEHIIEKHANESKTLKDPIMKQLKCPLCKAKCGAQYLSLCRHLISSHEYQQYKMHLRELVHVSAFGWNAARQQEVAKTAKIFQFTRRKTFFFECKICRKVVAGYLHHLRHVNKHQASPNEETKVKILATNEILPPPTTMSLANASTLELGETQKKDKVCVLKTLKQVDDKSKKLATKSKLNNKSIQIEKVNEKTKKTLKPNENVVQKSKVKSSQTAKLNKPLKIEKSKKTALSTKSKETEVADTNVSKQKIQIKIKLKPKDKETKKIPSGEKLNKGRSKKDSSKTKEKVNEKLRGKSKGKVKDTDLKHQVKKVKVKPPVRQIELQKYKCNYCLKKIKGFRLYNLHILQQHKDNEYIECNKCNKLYTNSSSTIEHIKQCPQNLPASKQKRKFSDNTTLSDNLIDNSSQLCANKVPKKCDESFDNLEDNNLWLKDLLKIKESSSSIISDSNATYIESTNTALFIPKQSNLQCCYCLHLFPNGKALEEHTKQQHSQKTDILIKYKPFRNIHT